MVISRIEFVMSSPGLKGMPVFDLPEFAFIGRSNVGKSSLINMICGHKGVAKVSGTPGKTRLINLFKIASIVDVSKEMQDPRSKIQDSASCILDRERSEHCILDRRVAPSIASAVSLSWYLVDLPGYGWAKLSKKEREKFEGMIRTYLAKRENLACTFLLIDSRLPTQKIDIEFMNWMGDQEISFIILFTKTDKLSKTQLAANLAAYRNELSKSWHELPAIIPVSSVTRQGKDVLLDRIGTMLDELRIENRSEAELGGAN